ncbi:hypothetical protein HYY72_03915 [Candidatus Woesearchaeota archaeon]|nr:hypothetical protein [Candidatus Woesearchaeota archaeon]
MAHKALIRKNMPIIALIAGLAALLLASGCTGQTPPPAPPANPTTQPQAAPSDFSIKYTSEGGFDPHREIITISPGGDFKYEYQSSDGSKILESYTGKLTAQEMSQLYNFTLNENRFFSLPEELGTGKCADGMSTYIEIQANGKSHSSGHSSIACEVDNANFRNVQAEILRIKKLYRIL